ncbi:MAG TPA: HD domain-containing protein [Pseudothermotoga sp.]
MYYKVSRDPIHSEIFLYPLEILAIDTRPVQRLRYLSQLVGAELVYPGATHNRFAHSLGVMHICGLYGLRLLEDQAKRRIVRLAGLLHDVGHGPFSHQFDDVVYARMGIKDGHDEYRKRILLELMPHEMMKSYERISDPRMKIAVAEDLSQTLKTDIINEDAFCALMNLVNEVFEGEETGTVEYNIVQGPLGADRLDFLLRDSYYSGTTHFGVGAVDRIIRNSFIKEKDDRKILCYHAKVLDQIYTSLFGRFMMYKNVYFHKTSRAADLMIQQILSLVYRPLRLYEKVSNLEKFLDLTDQFIFAQIKFQFENILEKYQVDEEELINGKIDLEDDEYYLIEAYKLLRRFEKRDLWKLIAEITFSAVGIDPSIMSKGVVADTLQKIRLRLENLSQSPQIPEEDRRELRRILDDFEELFKTDTPYKLSLVHPDEFLKSNVYLYDSSKNEVFSLEEFLKEYPAYQLMANNLVQMVRVYVTEDIRQILKKYDIVPKTGMELTTRW